MIWHSPIACNGFLHRICKKKSFRFRTHQFSFYTSHFHHNDQAIFQGLLCIIKKHQYLNISEQKKMHSKGQMVRFLSNKDNDWARIIFKHQIFTHFSCLSNHRLTLEFFTKLSLDLWIINSKCGQVGMVKLKNTI